MTADKLCNAPQRAVLDMLEGAVALNPSAVMLDAVDQGVRVVCNAFHDPSKVAVISGGGSGHEPAMAGFVGPGMLSAAVAGDVFASPSTRAVYEAIMKVTGAAGCLVVVLNYTGDRLNFGMAIETARADGLHVEMTAVADDCGVDSPGIAGPRGIAGTMIVIKVACAAAAAGASLEEVHRVAASAAASVSSMGAALSMCTLPGAIVDAESALEAGTMELGLGIHGERACRQPGEAVKGSAIDREMLDKLKEGDDVVVLLNNLGGTTSMEMMIVARDTLKQLAEKGLTVKRMLIGTFVSSLDMAGVSISVMHVTDSICILLDAPTEAPAWPRSICCPQTKPLEPLSTRSSMAAQAELDATRTAPGRTFDESHLLIRVLQCCAKACIAAERELTRQDKLSGDGDCGQTIKQGAEGIIDVLPSLCLEDLGTTALQLASAVGKSMGGTSGALYSIFFAAAAVPLKGVHADAATPAVWAEALASGVNAIKKYGRARAGDRSMVDAMEPAANAASITAADGDALQVAKASSSAAQQGAEATKSMAGRAGRSGYVNASILQGVPDPGAHAVSVWMQALTQQLEAE